MKFKKNTFIILLILVLAQVSYQFFYSYKFNYLLYLLPILGLFLIGISYYFDSKKKP